MAYKQIFMKARRGFVVFSRTASSKLQISENIGPGGFALLTVPVVTFCLGTWQVKRRTWKLNLIEEMQKKLSSPPVDFPEDVEKLSKMEYCRVHVRGKFDHSKELYMGPRQLITETDEGGGVFSSRPKSGNLVITPFHITDRDITVLVNRGWVPRHKTDPTTRKEGQIEEEIDLIGIVRLTEKRPQFSPKTQLDSKHFYYRDVPKMAAMTWSEPIFLDAGQESTIPGGPIGGQTRVTFRNEHLSYIITWYSLCAVTSYMWYKKYLRGTKFAL